MTPEQFCYWLQGFTELTEGSTMSQAQFNSIRDHLKEVFKKVTTIYQGDAVGGTTGQGFPHTQQLIC